MKKRVVVCMLALAMTFSVFTACGTEKGAVKPSEDNKLTDTIVRPGEKDPSESDEKNVESSAPSEEHDVVVGVDADGDSTFDEFADDEYMGISNIPEDGYTYVTFGDNVTANVLSEYINWNLDAETPNVGFIYMVENHSHTDAAYDASISVGDSKPFVVSSYHIAGNELGYFYGVMPLDADTVEAVKDNPELNMHVTVGESDYKYISDDLMFEITEDTESGFTITASSDIPNVQGAGVALLFLNGEQDVLGHSQYSFGEANEGSDYSVIVPKESVPEGTVSIYTIPQGYVNFETEAE